VLGLAGLAVSFADPDSLPVDRLLGHHLSGALWGIPRLFVGVGAVIGRASWSMCVVSAHSCF
jgi:hypothetical protein